MGGKGLGMKRTPVLAAAAAQVVAILFLVFGSAEAAAPTDNIDITIKTLCVEKGTHINILNNGPKWPDRAKLHIYYADDKSPITVRSVNLGQGHSVSFRIRTKVAEGRPLGVYVEPSWYTRDFKFDATEQCA